MSDGHGPPRVPRLVEAREIDPPEGVAAAHWRLLSTHAVTTLAQARQVTAFYRERWTIEQLFRVMKTKGLAMMHVTGTQAE